MDAEQCREHLERFIGSPATVNTLALFYGRRRIGKSTLLADLTAERQGFYWEATRAESAVHLGRLGDALGAHLKVGRLRFDTWEEAVGRMVQIASDRAAPVVIDEFGYLLEADPGIDSVVSTVLGPVGKRTYPGRARLILCGSAIAMMRSLTGGEAPLRGRSALELVMQPFDFRMAARQLLPGADWRLAARVYAVIGGVIGYATDMVDHDLPATLADFDRWIAARVLSPAATLHHEATTLLAEDPTLSSASPTMHHSILGAIANGAVTAGTIANQLRRSVPSIDPALKRLIAAGFVVRHTDPVREQRPTYALADPFLQFHYAVLEPNRSFLRDRDPAAVWERKLSATFDSLVRGPVFEEQARAWVRRYADSPTLEVTAELVGPSTVNFEGKDHQLDVVVATGAGSPASERTVHAVGEAKAGETVGTGHLRRLEKARAALGTRAAHAKLMLFGTGFTPEVESEAERRSDVELIGLDRLYGGA